MSMSLRDGLDIAYEQGDMAYRGLMTRALTSYSTRYPTFREHILPVGHHCARILRPSGRLLSGFMNPLLLFDHDDLDRGGPMCDFAALCRYST